MLLFSFMITPAFAATEMEECDASNDYDFVKASHICNFSSSLMLIIISL